MRDNAMCADERRAGGEQDGSRRSQRLTDRARRLRLVWREIGFHRGRLDAFNGGHWRQAGKTVDVGLNHESLQKHRSDRYEREPPPKARMQVRKREPIRSAVASCVQHPRPSATSLHCNADRDIFKASATNAPPDTT